eukprot:TRINITY_DN55951_c0_g1_i1.p1 TRINITY_DN55951_c0_g1~~TRINITY_DN55951_c0_g1_i1.p1  ORF type:complete len:136 (-),score=3.15 TRINITY_DN55951_c0_g1_i1:42-449(-)
MPTWLWNATELKERIPPTRNNVFNMMVIPRGFAWRFSFRHGRISWLAQSVKMQGWAFYLGCFSLLCWNCPGRIPFPIVPVTVHMVDEEFEMLIGHDAGKINTNYGYFGPTFIQQRPYYWNPDTKQWTFEKQNKPK